MSYLGLFWETGMPEAWALSRRAGEKPDGNMASLTWTQAGLDGGSGVYEWEVVDKLAVSPLYSQNFGSPPGCPASSPSPSPRSPDTPFRP